MPAFLAAAARTRAAAHGDAAKRGRAAAEHEPPSVPRAPLAWLPPHSINNNNYIYYYYY